MVSLELQSHLDFFDRLVELIPAKHYLADPDERVDLRHMKKKDREAAKEQFKKQHKEFKKVSLNPSTAKGTLELLKLRSEAEERAREENQQQKQQQQQQQEDGGEKKTPIDRDALRAKLQARLEDLRKQRKADETEKKVGTAKEWRDSALEQGRKKATEKRKHDVLATKPPSTAEKLSAQQQHSKQDGRPTKQQRTSDTVAVGAATAAANSNGFAFSRMDFGSSERRKGKQKPSKAELLEVAVQKKNEIEGGAADPSKLSKEAWAAAFKRAQGEKVLDDPKLLRKSIKKDVSLKKKKTQQWGERTARQKEEQQAKQDKRRNNLQRRIDAKKESKKEKREKKLLRAGFEGRKQGFIATPGKK